MIPAIIVFIIVLYAIRVKAVGRRRSKFREPLSERRTYYREVYLKSDAWRRKRFLVLRRDNWRCVYCGGPATEVHHRKYARVNIGKEPIEWLDSICRGCHEGLHS